MPLYRATVKLNRSSGVAKDASVNVFHLATPTVSAGSMPAWGAAIGGFYNGVIAAMSPAVSRASLAHTVDFSLVNRNAAGAGDDTTSPIVYSHPFSTLATIQGGFEPLPSEVALCLSYRTENALNFPEAAGLLRPRSRRRGRMFLGPLNVGVLGRTAANNAEFTVATRNLVITAFLAMIDGLRDGGAGPNHAAFVVYSPSDNSYRAVDWCHIDNAPDTVRGRGEASSSRVESIIQDQVFTELQ